MKERIQRLLVEAGVINNNFNPLAYEQWYLDSLEKFAELIVRECVKNLETNKKCDIYTGELTDCDWNDIIQYQIDSLKEHFEIEE
jgi:hypothetical protein